MRFIFKTDYAQDIKLGKHGGQVFWYSALMLLMFAAPWLFAEYWLAQLTLVLIYSIAGLGLMLLAGFTGQFSMGHAAFLGVGAYTQAVMTNAGVPFPIAMACAAGLSAAVGVVASRSATSDRRDASSPQASRKNAGRSVAGRSSAEPNRSRTRSARVFMARVPWRAGRARVATSAARWTEKPASPPRIRAG